MTGISAPAIDAVLFDKDGTLFDFAGTWEVWAAGFLRRVSDGDQTRATRLGDAIGYDFAQAKFRHDSVAIAGTPDDMVSALAPEFPNLSPGQILHMINDEAASAPLVEAVPLSPYLTNLRGAGLKLGVATNDAEAPALAHLEAFDVHGLFDFIAGSDSGYGAKPEPGQLFAFCDHVDVQPDRVLMVGDSTHDLVAGRAAGMWTAAVLTGMAQTDELAPYSDIVVPDIGHLPGWLGLH